MLDSVTSTFGWKVRINVSNYFCSGTNNWISCTFEHQLSLPGLMGFFVGGRRGLVGRGGLGRTGSGRTPTVPIQKQNV